MRTGRQIVPAIFAVAYLMLATAAFAQPPPVDFLLKATSGGLAPSSQATTVALDASGHATSVRYKTGGANPILAETTFVVSPATMQRLWEAIQSISFLTLASPPPDTSISDGSYAKITVTANGATHQVLIRNVAQPQIQALIDSVNAVTPPACQLHFEPPQHYDLTPRDPCLPVLGTLRTQLPGEPNTQSVPNPKMKGTFTTNSVKADVVVPHPGVVVAYRMPLAQAVSSGIATLKSKGQFFGDDVSITVDNRVPHPSNIITITLYLEFWGPLATHANVERIAGAIDIKLNGRTTSSGQKVTVEVITRANPGASAPPSTPGYEQIKLVPFDAVRSYVGAALPVNTGAVNSVWEVGLDPGVYAHEAGHLMGLPDRYDDYNKQADGSWTNATSGKSYANDDVFAAYVLTKTPGSSLEAIKGFLKNVDIYGLPRDGSENDLMGDDSKPMRQSDIDLITAHPGLLVKVPAGGVFVNKKGKNQNVVVTHSEDLFVKPGERRSLNGIYGACIDLDRSAPDSLELFDVAPSVDQWNGISAAGYLTQLIHFVDSAGAYCSSNFATQAAIWRITDNSVLLLNNDAETLLGLAGIHLGDQPLDFPRLSTRSSDDSTTIGFVPDELFAAHIQPRNADGIAGNPSTFSATVAQPGNGGFTTSFTWTAHGPDTASVPISGIGSTGSLTPQRSGAYDLGLNISVMDSALYLRTFKAPVSAYLIVPDSLTETFEHAHLSDRYPWRTYGNAPWSITSANPQTGSFAAQAGSLGPNQTSVLEVDLALPSDAVITYSIRTSTVEFLDQCQLLVDSAVVSEASGIKDWRVIRHPLKAGNHTLAWKCMGPGSTAGKVWLDNVFFPPHSIATSARTGVNAYPDRYVLYQNYPNPFNPVSTIGFDVPALGDQAPVVTLKVFDVLGREVAVLVNERKAPGRYTATFDGTHHASGVYYYRLTAGAFVYAKAMVLAK